MRKLKPEGLEINLDDKPRKILFTLNAIDEIQEHFDETIYEAIMKTFSEEKDDKRNSWVRLRKMLQILLNEDAEIHNEVSEDKWEALTEKQIGRLVTIDNLSEVSLRVMEAFTRHLKTNEEDEDEESGSPNSKSARQK